MGWVNVMYSCRLPVPQEIIKCLDFDQLEQKKMQHQQPDIIVHLQVYVE